MLVTRSAWESTVYLGLAGSTCGGRGFELVEHRQEIRAGERYWVYETTCPRCGERRRFEFAVADEPAPPYPEFGGAQPSQLIDAGQFLAIGERAAAGVPEEPAGLSGEEFAAAYESIAVAVAAVGEAVKLVPPGADAVPPSTLRSPESRELYALEPYRFQRRHLLAVLGAYREVQAAYVEHGTGRG
jgi:hypothetical protein